MSDEEGDSRGEPVLERVLAAVREASLMGDAPFHIVEEGGVLKQGINVYPPWDAHSFGARLLSAQTLFYARYSGRHQRWFASVDQVRADYPADPQWLRPKPSAAS